MGKPKGWESNPFSDKWSLSALSDWENRKLLEYFLHVIFLRSIHIFHWYILVEQIRAISGDHSAVRRLSGLELY